MIPSPPDAEVIEVSAPETYALRRSVLRASDPIVSVAFDGDDHPTTVHLAACRSDGTIIGVSTWLSRFEATTLAGSVSLHGAVQLRGMAVTPDARRGGVGSLLLASGVNRARSTGSPAIWARARDTALAFYERHGFVVVGDGYVDATTALPHHDVILHL